jgi:hypothetical protein
MEIRDPEPGRYHLQLHAHRFTISSFLNWWFVLDLWTPNLLEALTTETQATPVRRAIMDRIRRLSHERIAAPESIEISALFLLAVLWRWRQCRYDFAQYAHDDAPFWLLTD